MTTNQDRELLELAAEIGPEHAMSKLEEIMALASTYAQAYGLRSEMLKGGPGPGVDKAEKYLKDTRESLRSALRAALESAEPVAPRVEALMADVSRLIGETRPGMDRHWMVRIQCAAEALRGTAVEPDIGPWEVSADGRSVLSDNFEHDVSLVVKGDFFDDESRRTYARDIARRLSASPPPESAALKALRELHSVKDALNKPEGMQNLVALTSRLNAAWEAARVVVEGKSNG